MSIRMVTVHPPDVAAARLGGISVGTLVALLRAGGYPYTMLKPGGAPWGRGRQTWGLTDDQIAAVADGQARTHARPADPGAGIPAAPARVARALPGHDGRSRLKRRRGASPPG